MIPVTWQGHQIGWSTDGFEVELFPIDDIPDEAKPIVKQMIDDSLKGISIDVQD